MLRAKIDKLFYKNLLLVFILFPILVFSQTKTISGTVNDENNLPLVGVNISVQNSEVIKKEITKINFMKCDIFLVNCWN